MSSNSPYIQKENITAAAGFIAGPLWADIKRCLLQRRVEAPVVTDEPNAAAAKSHQRTGFEKCIEEIEKLPFEMAAEIVNPFDRPATQDTAD